MSRLVGIAFAAMLLALCSVRQAQAAPAVVQMGGGYKTIVTCDATRLRFKRISDGEAMVRCSDTSATQPPTLSGDEIRLDPSDSTLLICEGKKLVQVRLTGGQIRAICRAIAPASI